MHNKNNNKTSMFIQGLRPFSSSIPKTLKKHLRKGGYNYSNIVDNWTNMVSKKNFRCLLSCNGKNGKRNEKWYSGFKRNPREGNGS